jgi:hypothetical protein
MNKASYSARIKVAKSEICLNNKLCMTWSTLDHAKSCIQKSDFGTVSFFKAIIKALKAQELLDLGGIFRYPLSENTEGGSTYAHLGSGALQSAQIRLPLLCSKSLSFLILSG